MKAVSYHSERTLEMKERNKSENKSRAIRLPRLRLRYRLALYFFMIVSAALSLVSVVFDCFHAAAEMVFYVLAAVTLAVGSYYLTMDIKYGIKEVIKPGIAANPYTNRVAADARLRTVVFVVPGLVSNILFAVFNGVVGILSHSAWFGSLAAYYILLSMMRLGAVRKEQKISKIQSDSVRMQQEIAIYRKNSRIFIAMAVVLGGMVILLEASLGGKSYPGFTIYAAAFYAFYRIIMSIVNMIKVNRHKSLLLKIIRKIGYVDACVSMLTLQTAMFASFADGEEEFVKMMNGITGTAVSVMVLGMGIQGICVSRKMVKLLKRSALDDSYTGSGR